MSSLKLMRAASLPVGRRSYIGLLAQTPKSSLTRGTYDSPQTFVKPERLRRRSTLVATRDAHVNVFEDARVFFKRDENHNIFRSLQARYPEYTVTQVDASAGLLDFARAGEATATLDTEGQNLHSYLKYEPAKEEDEEGTFKDLVKFGRYNYQWNDQSFIVYLLCDDCKDEIPTWNNYFVLHKKEGDQIIAGCSSKTKELVQASSSHTDDIQQGDVLVYDDNGWTKSDQLWESVQKSKWGNVILDENLKKGLIRDVEGFFDQGDDYDSFEVPWQRGIILHGLPGNGKTITVKALMNGLSTRDDPIPTLYVKAAKGRYGPTHAIRQIFQKARQKSPCLLVFEDLDSLITQESRSFFLNEVEGMETNHGIMMIGSTNYLEKLDAGITKRPSRFDRKYHFDLPAIPERTRYCEYWRSRLSDNRNILFPAMMCSAIAGITDGFSFAYLQEAFISSLLVIVRQQRDSPEVIAKKTQDSDPKSLESVLLWQVMCKQVDMLRNEIKGSRKSAKDAMEYIGPKQASKAGFS